MERQINVGDYVIYHHPNGQASNALVTVVWSNKLINLVTISLDENKQDTYGRQIERFTSVQHKSETTVHGFYWRFVDEEPNPYVPPVSR